jgi:hypothetical protein
MTTMTTIAARPVPAHLVAVVSDGYEFLAECSCGWASDWHANAESADAAGVEHREVAVGPPDAMDRLMTGLLDLQDDLAAVVVWLAEHWSADLPPLGWYANGSDRDLDRPVLWVIGACDPDELAPAAVVLDAVLADDPPGGNGAIRYRRAVRDIGRVRIEVFTPVHRCEPVEAAR